MAEGEVRLVEGKAQVKDPDRVRDKDQLEAVVQPVVESQSAEAAKVGGKIPAVEGIRARADTQGLPHQRLSTNGSRIRSVKK